MITPYVGGVPQPKIVDVTTRAVKPAIALPASAHGVAVTPDGRTAYVATVNNQSVTPVDLATGTAKDEIPVDGGVYDLAITPDGTTVYVVSNSRSPGFATAIDVATNTIRARIPVGSLATDVAVSPDGGTVYVVCLGPDYVTPIDVATQTSGTAIPVLNGRNPQTVAFAPDGRTAYVAGGGYVATVDVATAAETREISTDTNWSYDLAVSPVRGPLPATAGDPTITLSHTALAASIGDQRGVRAITIRRAPAARTGCQSGCAVGRTRISLSDTLRGRETAKAMICATSSAVIAVAA